MIEFLPWYQAGACMVRCSECGALLVDADTDQHLSWHKKIGD